uniref:Nucleoside diphosphate kinase n=1 Tax=Dunaliella tertiolecta TaxID=3047 RepID=Q8RYB9_DUNTE|nr:nucleoside diphosphate kinase [Dunaliella tertiolecta]|mmetsp:Transcript_12731/g.34706  ORF Transcript_12731/g.34706 Transcript_12731/m.34706 type:complete len:222 (-) Transcript_12731:147-812(-)
MFRNSAVSALRLGAIAFRRVDPTKVPNAMCRAYTQQNTGNSSSSAGKWAWTAGILGAGLLSSNHAFAAGPSTKERSFIAIKPDGVHRGMISNIISRFEQKGYKLVGIKVIVPGMDLAKAHYAEHEGKPFFNKLTSFLTSGPVVAMVWEGKEVIKYGRTMIGATNPLASAPGTIRGDFCVDMGRNMIHGSDGPESAQREIALWFQPSEIAEYESATQSWVYE